MNPARWNPSVGALAVWVLWLSRVAAAQGDNPPLADDVRAAMRKAATYYSTKVASHGGYVYYHSPDLQQRWGEGKAGPDQIWVQPPGTPTVGLAYLQAYWATGDRFYLDAAVRAADALVYGQLKSGGWTNCIDFDPRGDKTSLYRNGQGKGPNNSTLDDEISQAAMRLLMHVDHELEFKNRLIHEASQIALSALLSAQYANGGFPQVWTQPVPMQPVVRASFPSYDWRTEGRVKNYWDMYTLNDNIAGNVSRTLLEAFKFYQDARCRDALTRLGDFLILAQMPDPQPAWAQQYSYEMHPIWARKFEPPAITGSESQDAIETLMEIYRFTGDARYLEPIPRALAYLRRSLLRDGRLARYYELQTNKPLYMKRTGDSYTLTHDDSDLPGHYGWKIVSRLDRIERDLNRFKGGSWSPARRISAADHEAKVRQILQSLDSQGRWLSTYGGEMIAGQPKFKTGTVYISSAIFCANLEFLSSCLPGMPFE